MECGPGCDTAFLWCRLDAREENDCPQALVSYEHGVCGIGRGSGTCVDIGSGGNTIAINKWLERKQDAGKDALAKVCRRAGRADQDDGG